MAQASRDQIMDAFFLWLDENFGSRVHELWTGSTQSQKTLMREIHDFIRREHPAYDSSRGKEVIVQNLASHKGLKRGATAKQRHDHVAGVLLHGTRTGSPAGSVGTRSNSEEIEKLEALEDYETEDSESETDTLPSVTVINERLPRQRPLVQLPRKSKRRVAVKDDGDADSAPGDNVRPSLEPPTKRRRTERIASRIHDEGATASDADTTGEARRSTAANEKAGDTATSQDKAGTSAFDENNQHDDAQSSEDAGYSRGPSNPILPRARNSTFTAWASFESTTINGKSKLGFQDALDMKREIESLSNTISQAAHAFLPGDQVDQLIDIDLNTCDSYLKQLLQKVLGTDQRITQFLPFVGHDKPLTTHTLLSALIAADVTTQVFEKPLHEDYERRHESILACLGIKLEKEFGPIFKDRVYKEAIEEMVSQVSEEEIPSLSMHHAGRVFGLFSRLVYKPLSTYNAMHINVQACNSVQSSATRSNAGNESLFQGCIQLMEVLEYLYKEALVLRTKWPTYLGQKLKFQFFAFNEEADVNCQSFFGMRRGEELERPFDRRRREELQRATPEADRVRVLLCLMPQVDLLQPNAPVDAWIPFVRAKIIRMTDDKVNGTSNA